MKYIVAAIFVFAGTAPILAQATSCSSAGNPVSCLNSFDGSTLLPPPTAESYSPMGFSVVDSSGVSIRETYEDGVCEGYMEMRRILFKQQIMVILPVEMTFAIPHRQTITCKDQ